EAQAFVEELREKLPKYDSLCHDYHYAMTLLHQNKEKEAFQILEEIMVWKQKIPLPVPMYRDYLLLLSHKDKDLCIEKANELPAFIINSSLIQEIKSIFEQPPQLLLPEPVVEVVHVEKKTSVF